MRSAAGSVFCANRWQVRCCSCFKDFQDTISSLMAIHLTTSYAGNISPVGLMQCPRILGQHANANMSYVCSAAALQSSCLESSSLLTQMYCEDNLSICIDRWHFHMVLGHLITNDHCHTAQQCRRHSKATYWLLLKSATEFKSAKCNSADA